MVFCVFAKGFSSNVPFPKTQGCGLMWMDECHRSLSMVLNMLKLNQFQWVECSVHMRLGLVPTERT